MEANDPPNTAAEPSPGADARLTLLRVALGEAATTVYLLDADGLVRQTEGSAVARRVAPGASFAASFADAAWLCGAVAQALEGSRAVAEGPIGDRHYRVVAAGTDRIGGAIPVVLSDVTDRHRTEGALRGGDRRLRLLLDQTPGILWTTDRNLVITSSAGAGLAFLGETTNQNVGRSFYEAVGSRDPSFPPVKASLAALAGQPSSYDLAWAGRSYATRIEPLHDEAGRVAGTIGLSLDLTERRVAEAERDRVLHEEREARKVAEEATHRAAFLSDASRVMASSFDYRTICAEVARLAVPHLADLCVFHLALDGDSPRRETLTHGLPEKAEVLRRLERLSRDAHAPRGLPWVLRTGQSVIYNDVRERLRDGDASWPPSGGREPAALAVLIELGLHGFMTVPLPGRERNLGALTLADASGTHHYGPRELELAEDVARRCALAIDNATLLQRSQEAVRLREEFLSIASHELRTPVTSLQLAVQNVLDLAAHGGLDTAAAETSLQVAERQTRRLGRLVASLLDVARIQAGHLDLNLGDVDLAGVAREVAESFQPEARVAGCRIDVEAPAALWGRWDGPRLEQVVTNLVANAIKYGAGSPVTIRVVPKGAIARLEVGDRGIGIPEELQARIFDRFERAAPSRQYAGLGLGLYITRCIVSAHDGTVAVASRPGEGTTFTADLPVNGPRAEREVEDLGHA